ncbi:hypothetical protein K435DRAFT_452198 [Dendrothele bispora CBS 962.96]|uniref:SAM domain-containing protein n=1 Tax=Dendrothele bispora (strain CBS 962.96) TaxID=1314807 RepID=A0A4S8MUI2_DENBC|nr:hypothetical protein K435DRAFT_452198 [Dendrothele bispora CBS 962.96]
MSLGDIDDQVGENIDQWFHDLQKYEKTLGAMAAASEDPKFREELGTIEQWFKLLTESEQTASLYTLLQHTNPAQVKFLAAVLQQMSDAIPPDNSGSKQTSRSLRPPNLNLPLPGTPSTAQFSGSTSSAQVPEFSAQELVIKEEPTSWANMVSTPHDLMFKKSSGGADQQQQQMQNIQNLMNSAAGTGVGPMNAMNVTMLTAMGFSNEQIVAMQLVMRGLTQPVDMAAAAAGGNNTGHGQKNSQAHHHHGGQRRSSNNNQSNNTAGSKNNSTWRSPGARYPGSALRNGPKSAGPKSAGAKSSGLNSATSTGGTPKTEDDVDPELLKDIPAWLKSLRLHKYTACFEGMTWQEIVVMDEPALEAKGVAALGARRRLTRTFEVVKKKMGMATSPVADVPPASADPIGAGPSLNSATLEMNVPHSAAPIL